jgi:hypothetical protein
MRIEEVVEYLQFVQGNLIRRVQRRCARGQSNN